MSTMQNLKNFIRHGKQGRQAHGDPTTAASPVHAQQQRLPQQAQYALSDPNVLDHKPLQHGNVPGGDYSAANIDQRNVAAQAGGAAAKAAGAKQKIGGSGTVERTKDTDPSVIERIVAEERESQGKLPKYPGLERWTLKEKMGDGAFSNVYRAQDNEGRYDEVAIKVVRKFEMNTTQVCLIASLVIPSTPGCFIRRQAIFNEAASGLPSMPTSNDALGRQTPSSRLQKAAQGCGGAHRSPVTDFSHCILVAMHRYVGTWTETDVGVCL